MLLLAIDTCGVLGGAALGSAEGLAKPTSRNREVGHPSLRFRELAGKTFSESLIHAISEVMDEDSASLAELAGIVVVHGPGSFTGIRIGISAAKGLAEALAIPLIAVSRLELLARKSSAQSVIAVLDAGRGEFFVGVSRNLGQPGSAAVVETLMTRQQLTDLARSSELPIVVCEEKMLSPLDAQRPELVAAPTAVDALLLGAERFGRGVFDDVAQLDANYLRRSETEMLARIVEHAAARIAEASARQ